MKRQYHNVIMHIDTRLVEIVPSFGCYDIEIN